MTTLRCIALCIILPLVIVIRGILSIPRKRRAA